MSEINNDVFAVLGHIMSQPNKNFENQEYLDATITYYFNEIALLTKEIGILELQKDTIEKNLRQMQTISTTNKRLEQEYKKLDYVELTLDELYHLLDLNRTKYRQYMLHKSLITDVL